MWIVVVVEQYYPSVFHFDDEQKAKDFYNKRKALDTLVHIAKVEDTHMDMENVKNVDINPEDIKTWDVGWCSSLDEDEWM